MNTNDTKTNSVEKVGEKPDAAQVLENLANRYIDSFKSLGERDSGGKLLVQYSQQIIDAVRAEPNFPPEIYFNALKEMAEQYTIMSEKYPSLDVGADQEVIDARAMLQNEMVDEESGPAPGM